MSGSDAFYARFASAVEQFGGGGWWTRLPGLRGRDGAEIDLKKLGIFPIVHGVRDAGAAVPACATLGTADRLRALVAARPRSTPSSRATSIDALHFLMGLKLANNLRQIAAGRRPGQRASGCPISARSSGTR